MPGHVVMQPIDIEHYLHEHIPLSKAMGVQVLSAAPHAVRLSALLAPNINHRDTVFGGSAAALALLAAWALLYVRLQAEGIPARVVIQRNSMSYEKPIVTTFTAVALAPDIEEWKKFIKMLGRKGRARIGAVSVLECQGEKVGELQGDHVNLLKNVKFFIATRNSFSWHLGYGDISFSMTLTACPW
jgi:thioesterase domain-containing protein